MMTKNEYNRLRKYRDNLEKTLDKGSCQLAVGDDTIKGFLVIPFYISQRLRTKMREEIMRITVELSRVNYDKL